MRQFAVPKTHVDVSKVKVTLQGQMWKSNLTKAALLGHNFNFFFEFKITYTYFIFRAKEEAGREIMSLLVEENASLYIW